MRKENFTAALAVLQELGAKIVEVNLDLLKYSIAIYYIIATAEASTNLAKFDGIRYGHRSKKAETLDEVYDFSRREGFGKEVKSRIILGTYVLSAGYQDAYTNKAQKVRALLIRSIKEAFAHCSLIAMPTSPFAAFPLHSIQDPLQMYYKIFTQLPLTCRLPSNRVPSGFNKEGKPSDSNFSALFCTTSKS